MNTEKPISALLYKGRAPKINEKLFSANGREPYTLEQTDWNQAAQWKIDLAALGHSIIKITAMIDLISDLSLDLVNAREAFDDFAEDNQALIVDFGSLGFKRTIGVTLSRWMNAAPSDEYSPSDGWCFIEEPDQAAINLIQGKEWMSNIISNEWYGVAAILHTEHGNHPIMMLPGVGIDSSDAQDATPETLKSFLSAKPRVRQAVCLEYLLYLQDYGFLVDAKPAQEVAALKRAGLRGIKLWRQCNRIDWEVTTVYLTYYFPFCGSAIRYAVNMSKPPVKNNKLKTL